MQIHPAIFFRGILAVVFFVLFSCILLVRTTPGAAEVQPAPQPAKPSVKDSKSCRVSEAYPAEVRQWCDLITRYAKANELHPDLVAGLIWYESGGNPTAYSRSGAVGLMQVMPRDGLAAEFMCINGPCFASRPTIAELENPAFNVEYGTRMLAGLRDRYQDLREGLKSYGPANAGYTYADKVLAIYERYKED
jgi:soluble lytic murein transglycosylase-like protein